MNIEKKTFKKVPILISKYCDEESKGWRAEIADNFSEYKTSEFYNINFEDLNFHFDFPSAQHPDDYYMFSRRKDAVEAAKFCNEKYLNNKAKIWYS